MARKALRKETIFFCLEAKKFFFLLPRIYLRFETQGVALKEKNLARKQRKPPSGSNYSKTNIFLTRVKNCAIDHVYLFFLVNT